MALVPIAWSKCVKRARTVRTGRSAAVGIVAEGVDVHATLGVGIVARDVPGDLGGGGLGVLLEDNSALDIRVASNDAD